MFYYNYSKTSFYERLDVRLVYGFFYVVSVVLGSLVLELVVLDLVVLTLVVLESPVLGSAVLRCLFGLGSIYVSSSSLIESTVSSVGYFFTVSFLEEDLLVVDFPFVGRLIGGGGF